MSETKKLGQKIAELWKEIEILTVRQQEILEELKDIRDLLRTGTAPDAFNLTPEQWAEHKCNRTAAELSRLIEKMEDERWKN